MKAKCLTLLALLVLLCPAVRADDTAADAAAARNAKLRESLRATMAQLQDAQTQSAQLQIQLDQANASIKDMQAKLDLAGSTIKKQTDDAADARAATDKAIADAQAHIDTQDKQLAAFVAAIDQWKAYEVKAERNIAQLKGDNQQLVHQTIDLQHLVDVRQTQNLDLYKTAIDILTRYENFGLGDALAAKEPFTGVAKVKLESFVQGYEDALSKSKASPATGPAMQTPKPTPVTL